MKCEGKLVLMRVYTGAWFPLALATILGMFFLFWSWAKVRLFLPSRP
jgi:K+ transporter